MEELLKVLPELSKEAIESIEEALTKRYEAGRQDQRNEQDELMFEDAITKELEKSGAFDVKMARSVLDTGNIVYEAGEFLGLSEEMDRVKKEYGFLFQKDGPQFSRTDSGKEEVDISGMNYLERLKLYRENPEAYRSFTK